MSLKAMQIAGVVTFGMIGTAMAQERITISSEWGSITAELTENAATKALIPMLPLTIDMSDHLRQEKTGNLPSPLPAAPRQRAFKNGTLGLWGPDHFVVYYRDGQVPQPGIVILGQVKGGASIFDRPGTVSIRVERAK
ncbi:cyclophilin-like fold protein [Bosea sp. 685]|uniref:cyclophilin-like fold protein n=1 Tax=Bosea sp. 685 TaxID=3080057 RepID=UPI002893228A|nr:cyclophilin-like fold protein [Bosea sp. 685]WNJ88615.1 cyclophilin-like fold protein [Bosea sp. 685]